MNSVKTSSHPTLDSILGEFFKAAAAGASFDRDQWIRQHPEHAQSLEFFFALDDKLIGILHPNRNKKTPDIIANLPGKRLGDYELRGLIGRGGMGWVFRAWQLSVGRAVAIKILPHDACTTENQLARFRNEALLIAALEHPAIVPVYEVGNCNGLSYYTMRLFEGGDLQHRLMEFTSPRVAASLVALIAHAIHYAHQRGILHRDLKPSNILLDKDGSPFISDFGLSKNVAHEADLTIEGTLIGTPGYMAPEQAAGLLGAITVATDVYGLGGILYALLTGGPPFRGNTPLDILDKVRSCEPVPPSAISGRTIERDLETICLRCLRREPAARYPTALALAEDLENYLANRPIHARSVPRAERAWLWCRRNPPRAALCACSAALLIATAAVFLLLGYKARAESKARAARTQEIRQAAAHRLVLEHYIQIDDLLREPRYRGPGGIDRLQTDHVSRVARILRPQTTTHALPTTTLLQNGQRIIRIAVGAFRMKLDEELPALYEDARDHFLQVLQSNPKHVVALRELAHVDHIEALQLAARAIIEPEQNTPDIRTRIDALCRSAKDRYEQALAHAPHDRDSLNLTSWFYSFAPATALRNPTRALELASLGLSLYPRPVNDSTAFGHHHALALYRLGRYEEALETLEHWCRIRAGGDGLDWYLLSMIHARLGHVDAAVSWVERGGRWRDAFRTWDHEASLYDHEANHLQSTMPEIVDQQGPIESIAPHEPSSPLLALDFSDGRLPSWVPSASAWRIDSAALCSPHGAHPKHTPVLPPILADFTLTLRVQPTEEAGIWLRSRPRTVIDPYHMGREGILLLLVRDPADSRLLDLNWHAVRDDFSPGPHHGNVSLHIPRDGPPLHLKIVAVGPRLEVYVNDSERPVSTFYDLEYERGQIAFHAPPPGSQSFDDIRLKELLPTP